MRDRCPYRPDVHRRLIKAATTGRPITYGELGSGRGWIGAYLYRIAHEEDAAGRPPLTAIVVRKNTGLPGPGLVEAMDQVGFLRSGETAGAVFKRATAAVFAYWSGKHPDAILGTWRPKLGDDPGRWPRMRG